MPWTPWTAEDPRDRGRDLFVPDGSGGRRPGQTLKQNVSGAFDLD
jgi:hypothetical protein